VVHILRVSKSTHAGLSTQTINETSHVTPRCSLKPDRCSDRHERHDDETDVDGTDVGEHAVEPGSGAGGRESGKEEVTWPSCFDGMNFTEPSRPSRESAGRTFAKYK
jgi:hypothetical protein